MKAKTMNSIKGIDIEDINIKAGIAFILLIIAFLLLYIAFLK